MLVEVQLNAAALTKAWFALLSRGGGIATQLMQRTKYESLSGQTSEINFAVLNFEVTFVVRNQ